MPIWGGSWVNYEWKLVTLGDYTEDADGTWTVDIGDVAKGDGVIFQFNISVPSTTDPAWAQDAYIAQAT